MEIKSTIHIRKLLVRFCLFTCALLYVIQLQAQYTLRSYTIKNGKMYIELNKQIRASSLDSFIVRYALTDIGLKQFITTNNPDSLNKLGWQIEQNDQHTFIISKPLMALNDVSDPAARIILTEKHPTFAELFPAVNNGVAYGYNRFKNKQPFTVENNYVRFYLRNNQKAARVMLAGSFNDWNPDVLAMTKTDSGWVAQVKLSPGKYWYKFIVDGNWITDNDNQLNENDGRGNINSVFFIPNVVFVCNGHTEARRVYLSGSFNNWRTRELPMNRTSGGWKLSLYLPEGTHTYKFIADDEWLADDRNHEQLPHGNGGYNSVIRIGKPHLFQLKGYLNARNVVLAGSFNGWREDELYMKKTSNGWELPYTLGPGNYEYKFKVDDQWILDPANATRVPNEHQTGNSFLIIDPNFTFHLKGYNNVRKVFLAGDFNNWNPGLYTMKHEGDEWVFSVHLSAGKHLYKFNIDGEWIKDPANKLWEQNEYGTGNSVLWVER